MTGSLAAIPSVSWGVSRGYFDLNDQDFFNHYVNAVDEAIPNILENQVVSGSNRGGVPDDVGIFRIRYTSILIETLIAVYLTENSKYYKDESLVEPIELASEYFLNTQHADGTIDYVKTNFHSTPDTAFCCWDLAECLLLMSNLKDRRFAKTEKNLRKFLVKAGDALAIGGIHTPNHRWVISNALTLINVLEPNELYESRINEWLSEGIDSDRDGQYAERSVSVYSPMVNSCFISMAIYGQRPELLDYVKKNLENVLYYIHPNGELESSASSRQDNAFVKTDSIYHFNFRFMAIYTENSLFATAARSIEERMIKSLKTDTLTLLEARHLLYFHNYPIIQKKLPKSDLKLPINYFKFFEDSRLVRIRRGEVSATAFANNDKLFSLYKGSNVLEALRISHAFFGLGTFKAQEISVDSENRIILTEKLERGYRQPLRDEYKREDGDWHKMDPSLRETTNMQELITTVIISEIDGGGFDIEITFNGVANCPVAVEMGFRKGGTLSGVEEVPDIANAYFLKSGYGKHVYENQSISFGPGYHTHQWTTLRRAKPKLNANSIYLTGSTPTTFSLQIK